MFEVIFIKPSLNLQIDSAWGEENLAIDRFRELVKQGFSVRVFNTKRSF